MDSNKEQEECKTCKPEPGKGIPSNDGIHCRDCGKALFTKPEEDTAKKVDDKPEIVITLENGFTGAIGFTLKHIPSAAIARFMCDEAKEHILAYIYQKKMEKEAVRRNIAGGKGFIPGLKDMFAHKH